MQNKIDTSETRQWQEKFLHYGTREGTWPHAAHSSSADSWAAGWSATSQSAGVEETSGMDRGQRCFWLQSKRFIPIFVNKTSRGKYKTWNRNEINLETHLRWKILWWKIIKNFPFRKKNFEGHCYEILNSVPFHLSTWSLSLLLLWPVLGYLVRLFTFFALLDSSICAFYVLDLFDSAHLQVSILRELGGIIKEPLFCQRRSPRWRNPRRCRRGSDPAARAVRVTRMDPEGEASALSKSGDSAKTLAEL